MTVLQLHAGLNPPRRQAEHLQHLAVDCGHPSHLSGIPYTWSDGRPVLPDLTVARYWRLIFKRFMDIALSLSAILLLGPLLVVIAIAVKLTSKGPVFFRQKRQGRNGREFLILKFRTMYLDQCDLSGKAQTQVEDDRVTPLGRWLRAKSIDELPQLLNVLLGDMSLVGPRPHVAGMYAGGTTYETLVPYYSLRHIMKPGLTGWAQVNGLRGPTDNAIKAVARVDHDLTYVQNFTLALDVKIIVKTAWIELVRGTGV